MKVLLFCVKMAQAAIMILAGVLFFASPASAAPLAKDIARCTNQTLSANHLTLAKARRMHIGDRISLHGRPITLSRGDKIWSLCRTVLIAEATPAVASVPTVPASVPVVDTAAQERISALSGEVTQLKGSIAALESNLSRTSTELANERAERRILAQREPENTSLVTVTLVAAACLVLIVLALALVFGILFLRKRPVPVMPLSRQSTEPSWETSAHLSSALELMRQRAERAEDVLREVWPLISAGYITRTLVPEVVEGETSEESRTFALQITGTGLQQDGSVYIYCALPSGKRMRYIPYDVQRELREEHSREYFLNEKKIRLKSTITGNMLTEPLPNYEQIVLSIQKIIGRRDISIAA